MAHVFLFDIDGTLLDSGHAGQKAMEQTLRVEFGIDQIDCDIPYAGRTDRGIVTDLLVGHGLSSSEDQFARFRKRYFSLLPGHLNERSGCVLPGVRQFLEQLSARLSPGSGKQIGLLTGNFEQSGWMKIRHFNLDHHFSFGAFGDQHSNRDDVARDAVAILKQKGVSGCDPVWIIGDTPADVQCARAIGAKVLAVASGIFSREELEPTKPDILVDDFEDPDQVLRLLFS